MALKDSLMVSVWGKVGILLTDASTLAIFNEAVTHVT